MLGQSQEFIADDKIRVVVDTVVERCCPQKNIRMRRESRWGMSIGPGEDDAFPSQAVDILCLEIFAAVSAQPVRP